jgi:mono/diheme cytochrome c family protein
VGIAAVLCGNLAAEPAHWTAPAGAGAKKNPFAGDPAAVARGRTIYQSVCVACHGQSGKGDGPAGLALNVHPGDLTSAMVRSYSDGELYWKISNGRAPMPGFAAAYGEDEIWKIVSYIRSLSGDGAAPPAPVAAMDSAQPSDPALVSGTAPIDPIAAQEVAGGDFGGIFPALPGRTGILIAGYGDMSFESIEGGDSTFGAKFAPIILVKQGDNLLFESEVEFELEDGVTETNLEYAQLLWVVNDYLTIGAGKFLNPMNYYSERLHPSWINKLPSAPLPFGHDGGLLAGSQLGVQARGGLAIGNMRLGYAAYLSNGPSLVIVEEEEDGHEASEAVEMEPDGHDMRNGSLDFKNFSDRNDNLAVGGRIGLAPIPGLEVGYGLEFAEVSPSGSHFDNINALSQSIDFNYRVSSESLKGTFEARTQFVWVRIDNPGIAPLDFENNSSGGYTQIAYRPLNVDNDIIRNLEGVCRFDWIDLPGNGPDTERISFGLNYWLNSSTVLKGAFELVSESDEHGTQNYNGIRLQAAIGF